MIWNYIQNIRFACGILRFSYTCIIKLLEVGENYRCPIR